MYRFTHYYSTAYVIEKYSSLILEGLAQGVGLPLLLTKTVQRNLAREALEDDSALASPKRKVASTAFQRCHQGQ